MLVVLTAQARAKGAGPQLDAATTVQLPTFGVAISAEGVLSLKTFEDPTGQLRAAQMQAAKMGLAANLQARSLLRKVSLVRLEAAVRQAILDGKKPDQAMAYLAGLQRVQFVFYLPQTRDIVIAGPAEGFAADLSGRVCGLTSGRLRLDDFVVALRAFPPGGRPTPFIGCTIDPTPDAMTHLQAFQKTIPHVVPENSRAETGQRIAEGLRAALGTAPIRVFGVSPQTHCAQMLVEADYRMKLIGIGLEQPPTKISSYFDLVGTGARQGILQRWWFTPNYVPELAQRSPVFAELRNSIDLLVAAAFIQQQGMADKAGWKMATFGSEQRLAIETEPIPKEVACAVNANWRGSRFVAVAGGGVSIHPAKALESDRLLSDKDGKLGKLHDDVEKTPPGERWWWD
jgi:hypothetical protein